MLALLLALSSIASLAGARTWFIEPDGTGDAPTIQAAIDSASVGDTVLLTPGTYLWSEQAASAHSMLILKPGLTLRGQTVPEATVLDAQRNGRVMLLYDVGDAVRIEGLTVQTGKGRSALGPPFVRPFGGGMYIAGDSRPTISNCIIRDNFVETTMFGAGIYCESAVVEDCQIVDNFGNLDAGGIGIYSESTLIVRRSTIRGNWVVGDGGAIAAGIWARNSAEIVDCWFEANRTSGVAHVGVAGLSIAEGAVRQCVFVANVVNGGSTMGGALAAGSGVAVSDCIFVGNKIIGNPARGSAMVLRQGAIVTRCTILGNIAEGGSVPTAGIFFREPATVTSSVFAWNEGAICFGNATWSCNNIYGNTLGDTICGTDEGGNFSADPQFCAVDPSTSLNFEIQADSPCAPGQHPQGNECGQVGAAPVGCGAVGVRQETWSSVKELYRE